MAIFLESARATEQFGAQLWAQLPKGSVIFLHGDLGAGKTTLVRGFLRAAGFAGAVKSPTYNLVEEYDLGGLKVFHFDLYRLVDPEELEWIGIRDYFNQESVCFIEWPEQGLGLLPLPDLALHLSVLEHGRNLEINVINPLLKIIS